MKIEHIGIAVKSLEEASRFYKSLGLISSGEEEVSEQKVRAAFFPIGEARIELLESTETDGPIARFIEKKGPGLHHICMEVPDLEAALAAMEAEGYQLIDREPRIGAGGRKVAFVHPKASGGVLIELTE